LGLSEISAYTLRRACKVHHIDAVQIEYSPFAIDIEQPQINLLKTCRELGVATIAYSPLGRFDPSSPLFVHITNVRNGGMLTGAYKSNMDFEEGDFRRFAPRFSKENFPKNLKLVDGIQAIAQKKGCTAGQLTLAWLLAQGDDIIPIPGTKKIKYLEENLGVLDVKVSDEEEKEIKSLVEAAEVHGLRYPEAMVGYLFASTPALKL
jgi:aryl-alcohol dehydrogenase-like predicted oxidoreductase